MTIFCIKKNIWCRFMLSILMFTAVSCSLQPEPEEEKEDPIKVYMIKYNEAVKIYAAAVSHTYELFYNETGLSETQFDLLRSKGELPTLKNDPYYYGLSLQDYYRQAKGGFYITRCTIMAEFLKDNGLLGLFTLDDRAETLYLLYEGEIFFEVRTDEDFRDALLLVLASQKGTRSIFALTQIQVDPNLDPFGREDHYGPAAWPVLRGLEAYDSVTFFYRIQGSITATEKAILEEVFEKYRQAFLSMGLHFYADDTDMWNSRLQYVNSVSPHFLYHPYTIQFVQNTNNNTNMGFANVGVNRRRRGSPVIPNRQIQVNTAYMSLTPNQYDSYTGTWYDFSTTQAKRSFMTSFLLFAVGRALGLGSMESHQDFLTSLYYPGTSNNFNLGTLYTTSHVQGVSIIRTRLDSEMHARRNQSFDFASVMLLPSYSEMRLSKWRRYSWPNDPVLPNQSISTGDRATLQFMYVTYYEKPIWITRL